MDYGHTSHASILPHQLRQLRNVRRNPARLIARELCGALRDGALRTRGAIGWEQFAAGGC